MIVQRLWGVLYDGAGSREIDDYMGSRENLGGKFWHPDGVSESL
jgi:hypothetical protein